MTEAERRAALEAIAAEVGACTGCRLHERRTRAVPGEGHPSTEVVFVGEGPGMNEDREGRPFVGRAGDLLVRLLGSIGWRREDVFITNVVKCRPPENRDPEPDEVAACAPFLRRQLEILDPALIVTLGRHSMARFMPGTTISRAHGTGRPADPATAVEQASYADIALVPSALDQARARRSASSPSTMPDDAPAAARGMVAPPASATRPDTDHPTPEPPALDQLTLFR